MKSLIALAALLILAGSARADDARYFIGQRHVVGGQGNTRICYMREMRMKLQNNVLTSQEVTSCVFPVAPDGTIKGHCELPTDTVDTVGKLAGNMISLHSKHVMKDSSTTCEYDMQMTEEHK